MTFDLGMHGHAQVANPFGGGKPFCVTPEFIKAAVGIFGCRRVASPSASRRRSLRLRLEFSGAASFAISFSAKGAEVDPALLAPGNNKFIGVEEKSDPSA